MTSKRSDELQRLLSDSDELSSDVKTTGGPQQASKDTKLNENTVERPVAMLEQTDRQQADLPASAGKSRTDVNSAQRDEQEKMETDEREVPMQIEPNTEKIELSETEIEKRVDSLTSLMKKASREQVIEALQKNDYNQADAFAYLEEEKKKKKEEKKKKKKKKKKEKEKKEE